MLFVKVMWCEICEFYFQCHTILFTNHTITEKPTLDAQAVSDGAFRKFDFNIEPVMPCLLPSSN